MLTLSASGLVQGTDFTCTSSYCEARSLGAAGIFRALQSAANALATRLGLASSNRVAVDGKIGTKTVELIQLLAISVNIDSRSSLKTYWSTSKAEVARDAGLLTGEIGILLQQAPSGNAPAGTAPAISTGTKPTTVWPASVFPRAGGIPPQAGMTVTDPATGQQINTSASPPILIPQVPTKYVAAGLVGAGLLVLGGVTLMQRRKRAGGGGVSGASRPRKTRDQYQVQVNYGYGHGWEYETAEDSRAEGLQRLREYRANAPQYPVRLVKKRVRV